MAICKICKTPLFEYEVRAHWKTFHKDTYFKVIQSLVPVAEKEIQAAKVVREIPRNTYPGAPFISVDAKIKLNERHYSKE